MHQSIMTKIKNYACKDWIVLDVIIKHKFFSVSIRRINSIKNGDNMKFIARLNFVFREHKQ